MDTIIIDEKQICCMNNLAFWTCQIEIVGIIITSNESPCFSFFFTYKTTNMADAPDTLEVASIKFLFFISIEFFLLNKTAIQSKIE
jgi:hypothetical protein